MSSKSDIEWTDATWNPVTGCTEVSPGCDHCYAKTFAERFRGVPDHPYEQGFDLKLWPDRLTLPRRWKKPRRIFVSSMSDLFHKDVPDQFILEVFATMFEAPQHIFQVLTKRPKRMARWATENQDRWGGTLPAHIWMGTTIERDDYAWRADYLRRVAAAVRFISAEPLLSALPGLNLDGIHWVIAGGESGYGARPMHPNWARSLRYQCQEAGVAFFFKQHGEWAPAEIVPDLVNDRNTVIVDPDGSTRNDGVVGFGYIMARVGKHAAGRLLDGREWNEYPEISDA